MRIAGYGRVSTAREAQLDSLEKQIEFFSQYAAANNHKLYRVYADEGLSGRQMKNRTEFLRMIEDAKRKLFDMVVVKDISRFSRNTVDLLIAVRELKAAGIEVQFLSNNQTVLGNSEFLITLFGALAQEESALLSKRVKFGKRINAQKGRVPVSVYGYRRLDMFHLEIIEEEAEVIRRMYSLYTDEGCGLRRTAATLNSSGITTRTASPWRPTTIRRMLQNPIYCGVLETNRTETVDFLTGRRRQTCEEERFKIERPELEIVSKELWYRTQKLISQRAAGCDNIGIGYSGKHLFSTLLRCECCGSSFVRKSWPSKLSGRVYYWVCAGRNNFSTDFCANAVSIKERELVCALQSWFLSAVNDRDEFARKAAEAVNRDECKTSQNELAAKLLEAVAKKKVRYKEMCAAELISLEELKQLLASLEIERQRLEKQLSAAEEPAGVGVIDASRLLDVSQWTNAELRRIVERISVYTDGTVMVILNPSDKDNCEQIVN